MKYLMNLIVLLTFANAHAAICLQAAPSCTEPKSEPAKDVIQNFDGVVKYKPMFLANADLSYLLQYDGYTWGRYYQRTDVFSYAVPSEMKVDQNQAREDARTKCNEAKTEVLATYPTCPIH